MNLPTLVKQNNKLVAEITDKELIKMISRLKIRWIFI